MTMARRMSYPPAVSPAAEVSDLGLARRSAFTLIELLVVIVIIGILAAMAMAVMFQAQEAARRSRTEGIVGMLSNQMAIRWDSYRTRRLPLTSLPSKLGQFDLALAAVADPSDAQQSGVLQLIARRQLMRIELPDRWWDVAFDDDNKGDTVLIWNPPVPSTERISTDLPNPWVDKAYDGTKGPTYDPPFLNTGTKINRFPNQADTDFPSGSPWRNVERKSVDLINRTSISYAYMRRYQQVIQQNGKRPTAQFQGAECLYMILTTGMGDESTGGGTFNQRDFADVDGDGMPEFVDAWGRPINFLRWAPGFSSDMQTGDPVNDHDPFDPRRVDRIAYRLFPLIVSAGPDGVLADDFNDEYGIELHRINNLSSGSLYVNFNDPFAPALDGSDIVFRGDRRTESAGIGPNDNIFNHALQVR